MISSNVEEQNGGKWRTNSTKAALPRGEMVRCIVKKQIKNPAYLQDFHDFDFQFVPEKSKEDHYLFRTDFDFKRR